MKWECLLKRDVSERIYIGKSLFLSFVGGVRPLELHLSSGVDIFSCEIVLRRVVIDGAGGWVVELKPILFTGRNVLVPRPGVEDDLCDKASATRPPGSEEICGISDGSTNCGSWSV